MQQQKVPENKKFSPYLVFFIITMMQQGMGTLGFQRDIAKIAGNDSWESVIFAGVMTNIIMWFIFQILETAKGDLCFTHKGVFGKWIGDCFNLFFVIYFLFLSIAGLRSYIEVIQVWMFPDMKTFWFALFFLFLCIYIIYGGIKTIIGIAFFSFALPFYINFVYGFALNYADFHRLFPMFNHSFNDILMASHSLSLVYLGYEVILVFSPFIKEPKKSRKWAYISLSFTTILYLFMTFIALSFYSESQLKKYIWSTLTTFQIANFPIVERFEFVIIANWCLTIMPNICISLWAASRILKGTFGIRQKHGVFILSFITLLGCLLIKTRAHMELTNNFVTNISFLITYIYIPFLFLLVLITIKFKKSRFNN